MDIASTNLIIIIIIVGLSCLAKDSCQHSDGNNATDADEERSCHNPASSVTRANKAPVYDLPTDVIKTMPNAVYDECTDGIEMKPNEVYGVGKVSEL